MLEPEDGLRLSPAMIHGEVMTFMSDVKLTCWRLSLEHDCEQHEIVANDRIRSDDQGSERNVRIKLQCSTAYRQCWHRIEALETSMSEL